MVAERIGQSGGGAQAPFNHQPEVRLHAGIFCSDRDEAGEILSPVVVPIVEMRENGEKGPRKIGGKSYRLCARDNDGYMALGRDDFGHWGLDSGKVRLDATAATRL
ncbi:hypothetical protein [Pararhizobium sp. LjRoot238]|uniref:hypothetical protein n=1 Tax=Pararhizobium sp. LjRoot238 TaxID=3342293 RepID=UPI003ECCCCE5